MIFGDDFFSLCGSNGEFYAEVNPENVGLSANAYSYIGVEVLYWHDNGVVYKQGFFEVYDDAGDSIASLSVPGMINVNGDNSGSWDIFNAFISSNASYQDAVCQ